MNIKLIVSTGLLLTALSSFAQTDPARSAALSEKYKMYQEQLNLTEEQAPKMKEINLEYFGRLTALRSSNESKMQKYRKLKSLNADRDAKAKKVLNPEQYRIYKQQQKALKDEFKKESGR